MKPCCRSLSLSLAVLCSPAALAETLPVTPGLWEVTSTRTHPFTGQPVTEVNQLCMKQSEFDPRMLLEGMDGCQLTRQGRSGNTLEYAVQCSQDGATIDVEGTMQTQGEQGQGVMTMRIQGAGMNMEMESSWTSRRLGEC